MMTIDELKRRIFVDGEEVCGNTMIYDYQAQEYVEKAYNMAIDDCINALNRKCDEMIKSKWDNPTSPVSWAAAYADFKDDIEEVEKQLKEGGVNAGSI